MIDHQETLATFAEVAVAITGFTAIAAVFSRGLGELSHSYRLQLLILVRTSIIVLFFSFIPKLVGELSIPADMVWRICCGLLGVTMLADVAWFLLNAKKTPTTKGQQLLGLLAFVVIVVLLFASAGMFEPYHLMFLASLLFMLYVSVHNFVLLLVIGTEPDS